MLGRETGRPPSIPDQTTVSRIPLQSDGDGEGWQMCLRAFGIEAPSGLTVGRKIITSPSGLSLR
jgi:hypothetical protein